MLRMRSHIINCACAPDYGGRLRVTLRVYLLKIAFV